MPEQLKQQIDAVVGRHDVSLWGVASTEEYRERFPEAPWLVTDEFPRAVVLSYPLLGGVLDTIVDQPTHIYFHHYKQVNFCLDRAALAVGQVLENSGWRALVIAASQTLDVQDRTAHVSHRHLGWLAGLGWRGKNNLLVTRQSGARIRLVSILTDAPLVVGRPIEEEGCGACRLCRDACPAGAIGDSVMEFDFDKCVGRIEQFRRIQRIGQRICGVCQRACVKYGRPAREREKPIER